MHSCIIYILSCIAVSQFWKFATRVEFNLANNFEIGLSTSPSSIEEKCSCPNLVLVRKMRKSAYLNLCLLKTCSVIIAGQGYQDIKHTHSVAQLHNSFGRSAGNITDIEEAEKLVQNNKKICLSKSPLISFFWGFTCVLQVSLIIIAHVHDYYDELLTN